MKMEYLPAGSPECPLIRLYEFDRGEAIHLKEIIAALAVGELDSIVLHEQNWITPIQDCAVTLRFSNQRNSVCKLGESNFEFAGSRDSWLEASGLLEPFCKLDTQGGFQWLRTDKGLRLLFSCDGKW